MTIASDILRQLCDPGTAAALSQGASALDALPGLQGQVSDLTAQNAALTAKVAELAAELHPTPTPTPTPTPPPPAGTIFGMNLGSRSVAQRTQQFGRVPMVKLFSLTDVCKLVPEKRAQLCMPYAPGDLSSGKRDAEIVAHMHAQLTGGAKRLLYTYRQEPEDLLKTGQAAVNQWKADTKHLAGLVTANGVKGVTYTAPCLIAPHKETGMSVPDGWMLNPDDLGGIDWAVWTWDDYGNPFGAKAVGGDVYATPYPDPAAIATQAFPLLVKHGWTNWGISEFNTPWRKTLKPADADHSARVAYLDGYVKACLAAPKEIGPPVHMLLWEEIGSRYDQTFTAPAEYAWWKSYVARSA
jgi:hypothetical protein